MSEDRLLSTLNSSESAKKSEKDVDDRLKNEDYDADNALKTAEINKTIREIRKENRDEDKIHRDLHFTFDPEKDYYEPKKSVRAFNNNYIQYESIGDKNKNLSINIDFIRPYLSDIIYNHKTQGE